MFTGKRVDPLKFKYHYYDTLVKTQVEGWFFPLLYVLNKLRKREKILGYAEHFIAF